MGKHICRSTSCLLRFEGRLDRLEDPLAGSHSIEALTERLAETGWTAFSGDPKTRQCLSSTLQSMVFTEGSEEAQAEQNAHDQGKYPVIGSTCIHLVRRYENGAVHLRMATAQIGRRRRKERSQ